MQEVVRDICEELTPFDMNDEESLILENRLERLEVVSKAFSAKVYRLQKEFKQRKYRKHPEKLEEKYISCSQGSILQTDDSENLLDDFQETGFDEEEIKISHPCTYKKKPLNYQMDHKTRRRRVLSSRETLQNWVTEQSVMAIELFGYILHLENYSDN